ncbi:MAG: hypothetical protein ACFBRM_10445 [Pikeienuella sp.]
MRRWRFAAGLAAALLAGSALAEDLAIELRPDLGFQPLVSLDGTRLIIRNGDALFLCNLRIRQGVSTATGCDPFVPPWEFEAAQAAVAARNAEIEAERARQEAQASAAREAWLASLDAAGEAMAQSAIVKLMTGRNCSVSFAGEGAERRVIADVVAIMRADLAPIPENLDFDLDRRLRGFIETVGEAMVKDGQLVQDQTTNSIILAEGC